jgi:hypothetical protein
MVILFFCLINDYMSKYHCWRPLFRLLEISGCQSDVDEHSAFHMCCAVVIGTLLRTFRIMRRSIADL